MLKESWNQLARDRQTHFTHKLTVLELIEISILQRGKSSNNENATNKNFLQQIINSYSLRTPGYELIYITNKAVGQVGYYQLISGKSKKNNCFSKFSNNSPDFFGWNLLKSWHFLYRRRRKKIFSDLQNFSTRNSPSVFPYLVKLNDNGSYHGLREPIRKLENHYPELKIY